MKRILFLMSDTGGGHRAAAEAIRDALYLRHGDEPKVELVDVFRGYSPFPFKYMPEFYPWIISHSKSSWKMGYNLSNTRSRAGVLSRGMYVTIESGLKQMFRDHPADVIVCVHSLFSRPAMQALLTTLDHRPPFVIVVTDLVSTHMFWYARQAERCLVPTQPAYDRGLESGMRPDQMRITGLPVHPKFSHGLTDKVTARAALGWDPELPALLLVGGGEGMGPLGYTAKAINDLNLKCQIAVIAGKNKLLQAELEATQWNQPTHIYGFVKDMPRLMAAADILITKAGPATISEACIAGLPMILYDAIPGQETGNVDYVVENKAGVFAPDAEAVSQAVKSWLSEGPRGLKRRSDNARRLGRPKAVFEIADEIWEYAQHPLIPTNRRTLLGDLERLTRQPLNLQSDFLKNLDERMKLPKVKL
jgi:1,2-diacylglycerol 3-beta-galactosyltransferase